MHYVVYVLHFLKLRCILYFNFDYVNYYFIDVTLLTQQNGMEFDVGL